MHFWIKEGVSNGRQTYAFLFLWKGSGPVFILNFVNNGERDMGDFNSYFSSIPKMETERLIFTAFTREDMNAYFEILRDKDVQRYL